MHLPILTQWWDSAQKYEGISSRHLLNRSQKQHNADSLLMPKQWKPHLRVVNAREIARR
jgi:hypothetical protein